MNSLLTQDAVTPPRKSTKRPKLTPEEHRLRKNARRCAGQSFKRGRIAKRECFICRTTKRLEFHHPDYAHALDVICLCFRHHKMLTNGKLSLIPIWVKAQMSVDRAIYALNYKAMMEDIIRRVRKASLCGPNETIPLDFPETQADSHR